ncbi:hypothetical protein [Streptomyces sp. NPDC127197]|uniref:hypothetical protein n=1 Tax=Streptomyces sp. NPDC127197 TaxID=3345388 RepID=UPI00363DA7D8
MNTSRRRTAKRWLTVVALGAIALTGCSQKPADRMESAAAAKPASSSASADKTDARPNGGKESADPAEATKKASPSAPAGNSGTRSDGGQKSAEPTAAVKTQSPSAQTGTRSDSSEAAKDTSASTSQAPFADTQQFVTINKAWTEDGLTYLSVRPAQKKVNTQFDTWEITPGTDPFTTVPMAKDAQALLTCPVRDEVAGVSRAELLPYSPAQFVTLLNQLDSGLHDGIGYDLVFDGAGQVTSLKSLYKP